MKPATPLMFLLLLLVQAGDLLAQGANEWRTDFSNHAVPLSEIVAGGPPKDGIPAIDAPRFESVAAADGWLESREPVTVVEIGDAVRVYPLQILIWHEIVNDELDGVPVAVTFCPLCNTTVAFHRDFDGQILDFGTTGRLRHSDLVMYDRQTETWWQQATGRGIVGSYSGAQLDFIAAPVVSWDDARATYPDADVLSRDTGYSMPYGNNPYTGYDNVGSGRPFEGFFRRLLDDRLAAMERVVTVTIDSVSVAYPFSELEDRRAVNDEIEDRDVVVFWAPGAASALDRERIAESREIGAGAVYSRVVDGRTLRFEPVADGVFRDRQSGSEWNVLGVATSGPFAGRRLEAIPHGNHFWFAWAVFAPATEIRD